ncbi:hypothetical protein [Leptospira adleri]|uniref:hypothetical protein n=1 Tax=Leptospira adleri TaxID=2023186 RepID=UPI0010844F60|nr:hypothetical protein [Leptospira adleri]TGM58684.1 hypothetical protein EHQ97_06235 [Leptospira adleri]
MVRTSQIAVLLLFAGLSANAGEPEVKKSFIGNEEKIKTISQSSKKVFFVEGETLLRILQTQSNDKSRFEKRSCVFCHSGSEKTFEEHIHTNTSTRFESEDRFSILILKSIRAASY